MATVDCKIREDEEGEEEEEEEEKGKEGSNLLGRPSFVELENGRFRCVETGHEMPSKAIDSYANSKRCRLGLIDYALCHKKPPLNMFKQNLESRSKLICKLTGDTVNKSEEHIWKHINGKRFLNRLEQKEAGLLSSNGVKKGAHAPGKVPKQIKDDVKKKNKKKKKKKKKKEEEKKKKKLEDDPRLHELEPKESSGKDSDLEEPDFWSPPVGSRWDFDDGGDRWGSDSESGQETNEVNGVDGVDGEHGNDCEEPSKSAQCVASPCNVHGNDSEEPSKSVLTKRSPEEMGPSSLTSGKRKKKKSKSNSSC